MRLGDYIKEQREGMQWSAQELADACGVKVFVVYDIERGKTKRVRRDLLNKLCDALELDADDVVEEFADEINDGTAAPRGRPKKTERVQVTSDVKVREPAPTDTDMQDRRKAADMVLNVLHMFCCEMNSEGRRLTAESMRMFAGMEVFKND